MLRLAAITALCALFISSCSEQEGTQLPGPTPRELLFDISLPDHVRLSPAGGWVSFAQNLNGVQNLWLKPADSGSPARPITRFEYPGVGPHVWHPSGDFILFLRQTPEADDVRPYVYDLRSQQVRSLFGNLGQQARFLAYSQDEPTSVYVMSDARGQGQIDIYRVDLESGAALLVHEDRLGANGYLAGPDLQPLIAQVPQGDGGFEWRMRTSDEAWRLWGKVSPGDALTTSIENVSNNGTRIYVASAAGRNTIALLDVDADGVFDPKAATIVAAQDQYDVSDVTYHPILQIPIAAEFATLRPSWVPLSRALTSALFGMRASGSGQLRIVDAARSSDRWLVSHDTASQPPKWGVFDAKEAEKIDVFPEQDALMAQQAAIQTLPIKLDLATGQRDGYLTIPLGQALDGEGKLAEAVPTAIVLRGAMASRERWAYRPVHQWLASRGVAVLSFNHVGSAGQGKRHLTGADTGSVVQDLAAAAAWLRAKNIASDKLAIVASGIGARIGLEWASGAAQPPACMALANPALNLDAAFASLPVQLVGLEDILKDLPGADVGEASFPAARTNVFIAHGAANRRQPFELAQTWADALKTRGNGVTLVSVNRAQDQFNQGGDARAVMAAMEAFLAPCLGFEEEPLTLEDFKDADISVVTAPPALGKALQNAMASAANVSR